MNRLIGTIMARVSIVLLLFATSSYGQTASPTPYPNTYAYKSVCPLPNGGKKIVDKDWEYECECTSYVANKLNQRGVPFWAGYKHYNWKWAGNWLTAAKATGVPYSMIPRVGDAAWYPGYMGHIAYVEKVWPDLSVTVSQYNIKPHDYNNAFHRVGQAGYPQMFIHF